MFRWLRSRKKQREDGGKKRKGRKSKNGYDFEDKCHIYEEIPEVLPFRVHGSPPGVYGHDSVNEGAYLVVPILNQGDKAQSMENIHDLPRERVMPRCHSLDILNDIGTRRRLSNASSEFGVIDSIVTKQRQSRGFGSKYISNASEPSLSDDFRSMTTGSHTGSSDTFFEYDFTSSSLSDSSSSSESGTSLARTVRLTSYRSRSHSVTRIDLNVSVRRALSGRAMSTDSMSMTTVSSLSRCSSFISEEKDKEFFDFSSYEADSSDGSSGYYEDPCPVIPVKIIDNGNKLLKQECCSHCKDDQLARRNHQEEIYVNNKPIKPPRKNIKNSLVSTSSPDLNSASAPFSHSKRILKQTVLTLSQTDIRSYNNKTNNRLLGDLMRKNYDKQLLYGL